MKFSIRRLAVLVLVASIAVVAAPALDRDGRSAVAGGGVSVTAVVRAPRMPPSGLSAVAEGYTIMVNWANPAQPYTGTLIEWFANAARAGTHNDETWHQYEIYYPPAAWAHLAAPMGTSYTIQASSYYDSGAALSAPTTASVVITSPVDIASYCPTSGYAPSAALRKRYGDAPYTSLLEAQLHVPGGARNQSMGSNPISWSPRLVDAPKVSIYKLQTTSVRLSSGRRVINRHWRLVGEGQGSFSDGYPAVCQHTLVSSVPALYKLVMTAQLGEAFTHRGAQTWKVTRYVNLVSTTAKSALSTRMRTSKPRRKKMFSVGGVLKPRRASVVRVSIQRLKRKKWTAYKTVLARSNARGIWIAKTSVKLKGSFRFRASAGGRIVNRYREYGPARSVWRRFKVR